MTNEKWMKINKKYFVNHALTSRDFILDLIFPIECLGCGQEGIWLCKSCFRKLEFNDKQYCLRCKQPNEFGQFCSKCDRDYALDGVWIAGDYENKIIASLIKSLKYHFAKDISKILGAFLSLFLRNLINKSRINQTDLNAGIDENKFNQIKKSPQILLNFHNCLLIPIPLHERRQRWRGFNQAKRIAEILANNFNLQLSDKLIRIKHKKPQAKLGEAKRRTNIRGCFAWQGFDLQNHNIILVDDVTTTGSTLNECAQILKQAGAGQVWGLVVAKG